MLPPPRLGARLLCLFLPPDERDCVIGDLAEEYRDVRVPRFGWGRARLWYWGQVVRSILYQFVARDRHTTAGNSRIRQGSASPPATASRHGDGFMSNLIRDIRYGLRNLAQTPTFTLLTVLTLGLAIGVNTAIFSMVNVLLLQSLPIEDTDTIAFFYFDHPERGIQGARMTGADFLDYRERMASLTPTFSAGRSGSTTSKRRSSACSVRRSSSEDWRWPSSGRPSISIAPAPTARTTSYG